jgi:hypothetical protein
VISESVTSHPFPNKGPETANSHFAIHAMKALAAFLLAILTLSALTAYPATEFFAIECAKLTKLAPTDAGRFSNAGVILA